MSQEKQIKEMLSNIEKALTQLNDRLYLVECSKTQSFGGWISETRNRLTKYPFSKLSSAEKEIIENQEIFHSHIQ
jgi:hypothetical protein